MSELITVEVLSNEAEESIQADSYDYERLPAELRDQAMLAQGTVLTKLGGAVERVIDAGNTLRWAKEALPHGEYLPWVQQACGLKERYAQQLVQAAEWVNTQHVAHLESITDTATLFLLSADATAEDVKEWVMERCAAGDPPTRKEVQERKRQSQGKADRTLTQEVRAVLKTSPEARQLAAKAEHITTRRLMDELDLDDLPKGIEHQNHSHLFLKNGTGWWKLPHQHPVETPVVVPPQVTAEPKEISLVDPPNGDLVTVSVAAKRLGLKSSALSVCLSQAKAGKRKPPKRNGWLALPHPEHGKCLVVQLI